MAVTPLAMLLADEGAGAIEGRDGAARGDATGLVTVA